MVRGLFGCGKRQKSEICDETESRRGGGVATHVKEKVEGGPPERKVTSNGRGKEEKKVVFWDDIEKTGLVKKNIGAKEAINKPKRIKRLEGV